MAFQRADRRLLLISRRRSRRPGLSSWAHQRMDLVSACGSPVRSNSASFGIRRSTLPRISYDGASPGTPAIATMATRKLELAASASLPPDLKAPLGQPPLIPAPSMPSTKKSDPQSRRDAIALPALSFSPRETNSPTREDGQPVGSCPYPADIRINNHRGGSVAREIVALKRVER